MFERTPWSTDIVGTALKNHAGASFFAKLIAFASQAATKVNLG